MDEEHHWHKRVFFNSSGGGQLGRRHGQMEAVLLHAEINVQPVMGHRLDGFGGIESAGGQLGDDLNHAEEQAHQRPASTGQV